MIHDILFKWTDLLMSPSGFALFALACYLDYKGMFPFRPFWVIMLLASICTVFGGL